jgi:hypothetical protein
MKTTPGCLILFSRLLAVSAALVFVLVLPPALIGRDLARVIFQPEVFSSVWQARVLDSGLLEETIQDAFSSDRWLEALGEGSQALRPAFKHLSESERSDILRLLIPDGWVRDQFSGTVREFLVWIDSSQEIPGVALDLQPLKQHLRDGGIDEVVEILVDSWPSCTAEGAARLERELLVGDGTPREYCEPSEPMRSELVYLASSMLVDQVDRLPDRLPLFQDANPGEAIRVKEQLQGLRAVALWAWFLPLSMLGLIMAFTVRRMEDFRGWWGVPLILSGAVGFALTLVLSSARSDLAANITGGLTGSGSILQPLLLAGLQGLIERALSEFLLQSLLLIVLGLVCWFGLKWYFGRMGTRMKSTSAATRASAEDARDLPGNPPLVPPIDEARDAESGDPPSGIFG